MCSLALAPHMPSCPGVLLLPCFAQVRVKALRALPALPGHRLATLLVEGKALERLVSSGMCSVVWQAGKACKRCSWAGGQGVCRRRLPRPRCPLHSTALSPRCAQVLSLRSRDDEVRAAAIEAAAELTARDRTLALAVEQPAALSALIDLWEGVTDALTGAGGQQALCGWAALRGWGVTRGCAPLCCCVGAAAGGRATTQPGHALHANVPHVQSKCLFPAPLLPCRRDGCGVRQRVRRAGAAAAGR